MRRGHNGHSRSRPSQKSKPVISTIAVVAVVVLAIFALVIFAASYGDLSARIDTLAESQMLLADSQKELGSAVRDLAQSHILIAGGQQATADVLRDLDALSAEQARLAADHQQLAKALRAHTAAALKERLITLCAGDRLTARQRYELEKTAHPGKSDDWYFKQAIASVMASQPPTIKHQVQGQ